MKIPREELEKEMTFTRFDRMVERYPEKTAILYLGTRFSYAQLRELSERFAGALTDMGVRKGDRVMVNAGSLKGLTGELISDGDRKKVFVRIDSIDQNLTVEVHPSLIEKIKEKS